MRREFPPKDVLYCQYQVFGATMPPGVGPRIEASYELRRRDGATVRKGTASVIAPGADGTLVRMLGVPLEGMDEGDYDMVLRIQDKVSGETRERVEPLRLSAKAGASGRFMRPTGRPNESSDVVVRRLHVPSEGQRFLEAVRADRFPRISSGLDQIYLWRTARNTMPPLSSENVRRSAIWSSGSDEASENMSLAFLKFRCQSMNASM